MLTVVAHSDSLRYELKLRFRVLCTDLSPQTMGHAAARSIIAPHLAFSSYIILRIVVPLLIYIPLSLSYALVSVAYDLPFDGRRVILTLSLFS